MNDTDMKKLVNTSKNSNVCNECIKAGAKYFLIIVDQASGFITTKFLKNKNDCFNHFRNFRLLAENIHSTKIKNITTDGGGEFVNKSFKNHCIESGINHIARCILLQSKLPIKYWAEAVSTATFLCNLIPKHNNNTTPHELWFKSKPPLNKLKPFGCKAWLKIPKHQILNKFESKVWDGIFLGYENEASSYRILRILDKKIVISLIQDMEKDLQNNISANENNLNTDVPSSEDENEDVFIDALEQQPQRIRVIGPRHPTLISSKINRENILPFS
ncbi:hypothetical protein O181_106920 [Austropuccinia psidii MF-1]|uniref:Integrase catalytic domain-containing protein n=1 Tax=Austropuccinia psidii MF-1 TaxID=1389203 RepID=A0A9Q3JTF3_9BASI|nr:hypothetical protein [Austropuccinia psidii MF-1]